MEMADEIRACLTALEEQHGRNDPMLAGACNRIKSYLPAPQEDGENGEDEEDGENGEDEETE